MAKAMALPLLKSIQDCGDYSKTVEPFFDQLYALPHRVLDNIGSLDGLKQTYIETNPLMSALGVSIFLGGIFLVVSEINRNYSQVDRMWSILPNLYIVHLAVWARAAGFPHERIQFVALFSTLWSIRLTFNYTRRGGYNVGSEDYRWEICQKWLQNKPVWFLFNLTFISFIQSVLLFAFSCVPAYAILLASRFESQITAADRMYFWIQVALVAAEYFADGQQYTFQTAKYAYRDDGKLREGFTKEDFERGFRTKGLFAYSRHPNFFAEQTIWFFLYRWSTNATDNYYSYTGVGVAALVMLFQGSTWLTELITSGKYPEYKEYKKQVGMFFPSFSPYEPPTAEEKKTK